MFRNMRYYRLDNPWPETEENVSESLLKAGFQACGPLTERSSGFMPVYADASESLARRVNGADLIKLRSQSRVLPAAVINEELEQRIEAYRERMGEAPSPREKRRMKAEARDELLPKAMLKSDKIWGYVDLKEKVLGIDAAQPTAAERFLRRLSVGVESINPVPLSFKKPVQDLLTRIFLGNAPAQFSLGRECLMQDAGDPKSKVRWSGFDLADTAIRGHVADGMHLTHLAIVYDNVLSFVLDENGVLSKIRIVGMDDAADENNDPLARLDSEFVLTTGTLRLLLADLRKALDGYA